MTEIVKAQVHPPRSPDGPSITGVGNKASKKKSKSEKASQVIGEDKIIVTGEHDDSRSISGSSASDSDREIDDFEDAMNMLNKLVKTRRVYVVGSIGSVRKTVVNFKVGFNKDGVALLNEYGRKLVDEVQKLKDENVDPGKKDKGSEELVDD